MKIPKPREGLESLGMKVYNTTYPDGTWVEGEELAYPKGGFSRRAWVTFADGVRRLVRCSIPDTFFSIPARGKVDGRTVKGFITLNGDGLVFIPDAME